jgi:uncharacterized protein YlzI (FlbEa/FlbD family)
VKLVSMPDSNGQEVAINPEAISTVRTATTKNPEEVTQVVMLNGEKIFLSTSYKATIAKLK